MLGRVIERTRRIPGVGNVVVATSSNPENAPLRQVASMAGAGFFTGDESDVLDRYYRCALEAKADVVVRITADCPLIDPAVSGRVVEEFLRGAADYVSNTQPPTFPDGLDTEVFSFAALKRAWEEAVLKSEREHVTAYIWKNPDKFKLANVVNDVDLAALRWTVDDSADLEFVRSVYTLMAERNATDFGMDDVLSLLSERPDLSDLNSGKRRNEGYAKSLSNDRAGGGSQ